ncbi:MAG: adenine deaminase [Flavisolibacter sp.]
MDTLLKITGNLVDVLQKEIYAAELQINKGRIEKISRLNESEISAGYIIPGFIDAHVHIESSMLTPAEFARLAVVHGTVSTVSDPHEIANVCGIQGVEYMINNGETVPFKFNFGAPSCVPATHFETSGAIVNAEDISMLLQRDDILYLTEMMNFPGVLNGDKEVFAKIQSAKKYNKPVDGHAPGLMNGEAKRYIEAGISTDHECFTKEEAIDKLSYGMKIIIREGSAAKNFEALIHLLHDHEDMMMFCSDDKHPDSLVEGHINHLCARAIAKGIDLFKVLKAACINPVNHYKLKVGLLRTNDFADLIIVKDLTKFEVIKTYINGKLVAENGQTLIDSRSPALFNSPINNFQCHSKTVQDFHFKWNGEKDIPVIEALDGQLITTKALKPVKVENDLIVTDPDNDILKIVVVNRYKDAPVSKAFIKNFGLKKGAIASSVAHDSHNIVAVGVDDESICRAVNLIIKSKGGVSCITRELNNDLNEMLLPLPVGGLMSEDDGYKVAQNYSAIDKAAKEAGCTLSAPFMTLSFMALLVIPHLKLSDMGLFDGDKFRLVG